MESRRSFRILLIRHGVTVWNKEKRYLGHTDIPLCEAALRELKPKTGFWSTAPVFSSGLQRCLRTAGLLWPKSPITIDERLREMDFGSWDGLTYEDLKEDSSYTRWLSDWMNIHPPSGETGVSFRARVNAFMEDLLKDEAGHCAAIVTHGGVIRSIISDLVPEKDFFEIPIPYGGGYELNLEKRGGQWQCSSLLEVPIQAKENS
ncbi:histidine phosphatase family protein [Peribacillus sp. SCS-26]|uniref:histidine phosphatase family protein n=1 Tax=Paraperibacillus marinus TaxID=3115295 RepID=UPI003906B859